MYYVDVSYGFYLYNGGQTMKNLYINGSECFRIENGKFYTSTDYCMRKVGKKEFKEELLKCNWIIDSWNKQLKMDYLEMLEMAK